MMKMETETLSQIIRRLSKAIEQDPNNAKLYYERGLAYFKHENWYNAEDDFSQAIIHNKGSYCYKTYYYWRADTYAHLGKWNEAADDYSMVMGLEPGETVEHGDYCLAIGEMRGDILPYLEERGYAYFHAGRFEKALDDFKATAWYTETLTSRFIAALATLEQYDLLEKLFKEFGTTALNECVTEHFAFWKPTPLYFITGKNQRTKIKDVCKMLRFLVSKGADVNIAAGDGSTPIWNQTTPDGSFEILQTLLELGGNPNQISVDDEFEFLPLANCLMPNLIENDENSWLPFDALTIKKAKLLLEHGANPNLANPSFPDYPPLVLAISYGFPQIRAQDSSSSDVLELISLLLQHGADPNFVDRHGNTPLTLAIEKNLLEAGQLLLLYGAKKTKNLDEEIDSESEDDADLNAKIALRWEQMHEKYERKPDLTNSNPIVELFNKFNEERGAMIAPPASAEELVFCDTDLTDLDFPELPDEYTDFLKICGGFAFDSVELYGTDIVTDPETNFQLIDIVTATEDFNDYYMDGGYLNIDYPLLCFGRWNGDYLTYDPQTAKYQVRSHECISDIWNEYDTFEEFFIKEVGH